MRVFIEVLLSLNGKMDCVLGGRSATLDASEEIHKISKSVKAEAEKKAGKNYEVFIAKLYKSQIVSGKNYFIKVHVGGEDYVHLHVHEKLQCYGGGIELCAMQEHKSLQDPI